MKHTEFDAQIKSSLEHLETEYQPASWDMLRQKMDRLLIEEDPAPVSEIDKAVFHKLQQVEVPYEPAHWDMLAARMNKAAHMRRRIWIGKIAEAAIFPSPAGQPGRLAKHGRFQPGAFSSSFQQQPSPGRYPCIQAACPTICCCWPVR